MSKDDKISKGFLDELESISPSDTAAEKRAKKMSAVDEVENLLKSTLSEVGINAEKLRASVKTQEEEKRKEKEELSKLDALFEPIKKPVEDLVHDVRRETHREVPHETHRDTHAEVRPEPPRETHRDPLRETHKDIHRDPFQGTRHEALHETAHEPIEAIKIEDPFPARPTNRVDIFEKPKPSGKDVFPPMPDKKPGLPRPEPSLQRERMEAPRKKTEGALFDAYEDKPKKKFPVAVAVLGGVAIIGVVAALLFIKPGKSGSTPPENTVSQNAVQTQEPSSEPGPEQNQLTTEPSQPNTATNTPPVVNQPAKRTQAPAEKPAANQGTVTTQTAPAYEAQGPVTDPISPLVPTTTPRVQELKPAATPTTTAANPTATPAGNTAAQPADTQPKKAKLGDLIPQEQLDTQPVVTQKTQPVYPSAAKTMGIEGTVIINALISETGDVVRTTILRKSSQGTTYGFESASEACVKQWKFKPAVKDGVNVKTWKAVAIQFKK